MGGMGSGRRSRSGLGKVEERRSLDVNRLHKGGSLRPGWSGGVHWTRDGEKVATINLRAEADRVHLSYRVQIGVLWQDVDKKVRIVRVPCRLGGERPYFICPGVVNGVHCRRRVAKLYRGNRYFLCRHCLRLTYASQSEGAQGRRRLRANKLWWRLGDDPHTKPKGMWRRTYMRLRAQAVEADAVAEEGFRREAERLVAGFDKKLERLKKRKSFP